MPATRAQIRFCAFTLIYFIPSRALTRECAREGAIYNRALAEQWLALSAIDSRKSKQGPVRKYVNNLIEQDLRFIKLQLVPMLGIECFRRVATTIAGIELMHLIALSFRAGDQFKLGALRIKDKMAPKFAMQFSPHDLRRVPERFVALTRKFAPRQR